MSSASLLTPHKELRYLLASYEAGQQCWEKLVVSFNNNRLLFRGVMYQCGFVNQSAETNKIHDDQLDKLNQELQTLMAKARDIGGRRVMIQRTTIKWVFLYLTWINAHTDNYLARLDRSPH